MSNLGMAIGTATGSIFGSLMGNKMQQDQFGNQLTLMKKQHEYNEASANAAQERAYEMWEDRKSTRLNSSHITRSRMPSSA